MAYADQQMGGSRVTSIVIVALIHVVIGYLLISGLAISAVKEIAERVTTVDVTEEEPPPEEEEPPPPEEVPDTAPPPPVAPPPPLNISPAPPDIQVQTEIPPPSPPVAVIPPPAPAAPPAPPPAPPSQARGATTKNERRWASRISNDYPSRALREEVEGTVGVRVAVGANGRATSCTVTSSSGSSVLDQAACRGMQRYARFNPALNDAGDPTTGSYSTRITYRLN